MSYPLIFVIKTGGVAGFFASVREHAVTHPPGTNVSADEIDRGGAGGDLGLAGGGTKPSSEDPSPARAVPAHNVRINSGVFIQA